MQLEKVNLAVKENPKKDSIHSYHEDIFNFMCSYPQKKFGKVMMNA